MEYKQQKTELKNAKIVLKTTQKMKSIRISLENQKKAEKFLALANKKKIGRTIKFDQALGIALDLLTEEHAKRLQDQSLSNEDRKEILRQKWAEQYGPLSKGVPPVGLRESAERVDLE